MDIRLCYDACLYFSNTLSRFYTSWIGALSLRVFRLNPQKDGNNWLNKDQHGTQASFRL